MISCNLEFFDVWPLVDFGWVKCDGYELFLKYSLYLQLHQGKWNTCDNTIVGLLV